MENARVVIHGALIRFALAILLVHAGCAVAVAAQLTFDLKVAQGRLPDASRLIHVTQDDVVTLQWTTDQPLVIHLHGYDIEKRIVPGAVTELKFTALATGRFAIHAHGQTERGGQDREEAPLAVVEVYPR